LKSFNNDFRISKEIFDGNTVTAGVYLARYTDHDNWSLGNQMLMLNQSNTKPIGLTYTEGGQSIVVANPQGFVDFNGNWDYEHYDKTHPAFTVGANYSFNDHMSAYVRANTGGHFDDFDNGIRG